MHPRFEPDSSKLSDASRACLARTRSAVLNVLVAVGLVIAGSGWLLRTRADAPRLQPSKTLHDRLTLGLISLAATSYVSRRVMARRAARSDPARREALFFRAHVVPALIAALAAPLGLAYGWLVAARLEAIIPFWVVPLALGLLSLPREGELTDLGRRNSEAGASSP
jgi:hypothetical protein